MSALLPLEAAEHDLVKPDFNRLHGGTEHLQADHSYNVISDYQDDAAIMMTLAGLITGGFSNRLKSMMNQIRRAAKWKGFRVTLLAFLVKASVSALRAHPEFNASLSPEKDALILKKYYNIGVAVDTPDGLVVPVIKDADRKGMHEISQVNVLLFRNAGRSNRNDRDPSSRRPRRMKA